jgi:hypothetical protein
VELDRAKEIIEALADGVDPYTEERFPPDGPYQRADTVRALYTALEALDKPKRARAPRPVDPNKPRAGGPWSAEEEDRLSAAYTTHKPVPEIAADHGRTPGAITARLVKLGLIEDHPANRQGQGNRPPPAATETPRPPASQPDSIDPEDCPF